MVDQIRHPLSLSKRTLNMAHKIPYVDVISEAILSSPNRRLTAKEIFEYVSTKYGPMKKAETLKNTIRHTLSRYKVFRKVQRGRQKKPNWWTVDEEMVYSMNQSDPSAPQWRSDSAHSIGGYPAQPQSNTPPDVYGGHNYLTPSKPPMFHNFGHQLDQSMDYKPKMGQNCASQLQQPIPNRIDNASMAGPSYQPMAINGQIRDFAAATVNPRGLPSSAMHSTMPFH